MKPAFGLPIDPIAESEGGGRLPYNLLLPLGLLLAVGFVNLYSATTPLGHRPFFMQLGWVALGVAVAAAAAVTDPRVIERAAGPLYVAMIVLLAVVLAGGIDAKGAHRWLGVGPFRVQPSEPAKLMLVIVLAARYQRMTQAGPYGWRDAWGAFALIAVPAVLILLEPDLGTTLQFTAVGLSIVWFAGLERRVVAGLVLAAVAALPLLWFGVMKPYQKQRVITLLSGEAGEDRAHGWQATQARIAVGSGGVMGKGRMSGTQTQLRFLPEQHTDFVFAVFAEEWGFFASAAVLGLFWAVVRAVLGVAARARDRFGRLVCVGVAAMFTAHVFVNVGMVMGILPVVGATLPLWSYGGSSLVVFSAAFGLVVGIHARRFVF